MIRVLSLAVLLAVAGSAQAQALWLPTLQQSFQYQLSVGFDPAKHWITGVQVRCFAWGGVG